MPRLFGAAASAPATVAITGAGGFVGQHLARELRAHGCRVVAVVRSRAALVEADEVVVHDLVDVDALAGHLRRAGVTAVCHLAWVGHPRSAGADYRSQVIDNIVPSANLGIAAGLAGVEHVVFVSTGGALTLPVHASRSAYGWAKHAVEALCESSSRDFGYELTVLRPTALIGPGQDPSRGLGAVTVFASRILHGDPIQIIDSPAASRDFLHVADLAACIRLVVERRAAGVFEVGGPEAVRLDDLVALLEREVGRQADVEMVAGSGVDPTTVRLDNSAITAAVGWTPRRTVEASLPEIVADLAARQGSDR